MSEHSLTLGEAAKIAASNKMTLKRAIARGDLAASKVPGHRRYSIDPRQLVKFIRSQAAKHGGDGAKDHCRL